MTRIARFARILAARRADAARAATETFSADARQALQRERLAGLVAHATAVSPFYRRWYSEHGVGAGTPLHQLPVLDKPTLMAHWNEVPADRGLTLAAARRALAEGTGVIRGQHVFQTGGSSGTPGVFAFDAAAIDAMLANSMRAMRYNGVAPRFPRRLRVTMIWAPGTIHMAARIAQLLDVGIYNLQTLPASAPVPEQAARLQQHRPEVLSGYASVLGHLAAAQLDGRLDIHPHTVVSSSEPLTPAIRARVRAAWGVEPFDIYATTESGGPLAVECAEHRGVHVFEDCTIVEPHGDRVLMTNLTNRGFPLIRFTLADLLAVDDAPCPCGRTTARITAITGRADDVLELPAADGGAPVAVHPSAWTPLTALDSVVDAEVVLAGPRLCLRVVARSGRDDAGTAVRAYVAGKFDELGVAPLEFRVEVVDALPRTAAGKRKLVRREAAELATMGG